MTYWTARNYLEGGIAMPKLPIKTDWVTIQEAVKILAERGISRAQTTIYSHARVGNIQSKTIPRGSRGKKRYLIYVPSLEKYIAVVKAKEEGRVDSAAKRLRPYTEKLKGILADLE